MEYHKFYNKNERYYHNIFHVNRLLEEYKKHKEEFKKEYIDYNEDDLITAIKWHDSFYEIGNPENEVRSAILYKDNVEKAKQSVVDIIESTDLSNKVFDTNEKKIMHDLDYCAFKDVNYFRITSKLIRNEAIELGNYDEILVIDNQIKFYKKLLEKPMYLTKTYSKYNEVVKNNLVIIINELIEIRLEMGE